MIEHIAVACIVLASIAALLGFGLGCVIDALEVDLD